MIEGLGIVVRLALKVGAVAVAGWAYGWPAAVIVAGLVA